MNAAGQGPYSPSSDTIACRAPPSAPKITSDLSIRDMTVIAGHEFKISVPFIGNPKPRVAWCINGKIFSCFYFFFFFLLREYFKCSKMQ